MVSTLRTTRTLCSLTICVHRKPPAPPGPPADAPPPEPPMPPEMPPAAKPGWRFTHRARPRRKKEQAPAPPPPGPSAMQMPPGMDPRMDPRRQVQSWATWQRTFLSLPYLCVLFTLYFQRTHISYQHLLQLNLLSLSPKEAVPASLVHGRPAAHIVNRSFLDLIYA